MKFKKFEREVQFWLIPIIALIIGIIVTEEVITNRHKTLVNNKKIMENQLDLVDSKISGMILDHTRLAIYLQNKVNHNLQYTREDYVNLTNEINTSIPDITLGVGVWFNKSFSNYPQYNGGVYSMKDNGKIFIKEDYSLASYNYLNDPWFKINGKEIWTDPYLDNTLGIRMVSLSLPLKDNIGVITADMKLKTLISYINSIEDQKVQEEILIFSPTGLLVNNETNTDVNIKTLFPTENILEKENGTFSKDELPPKK